MMAALESLLNKIPACTLATAAILLEARGFRLFNLSLICIKAFSKWQCAKSPFGKTNRAAFVSKDYFYWGYYERYQRGSGRMA